MAAGDALTEADRLALDKTIRLAEQTCRFEFSVFVGPVRGRRHPCLRDPAPQPPRGARPAACWCCVDPRRRVIEVVTGGEVRRHLTDAEVELAVLEMASEFAAGNMLVGLQRGIAMLAEHARPQTTLHA